MTTIEEMARTICLAVWNHDYTPRDPKHPDERWVQALAAAGSVIEKHIGPMIEAIHEELANEGKTMAGFYAARILSALTKPARISRRNQPPGEKT